MEWLAIVYIRKTFRSFHRRREAIAMNNEV